LASRRPPENFSLVLSPYKAKVLDDVREAVKEMKLIKAGKFKGRKAEDLFNEL
jgi:hypothetical protein